ncbi:Hypothetical predicted protein [Octopus vulgaris]|uniref:Uncharacterized protein n=1 Tax=Octopus vulgaris TaxID=6645 RepID=A0AA36BC35_OCTVU|nr:Hypothetical predicted protein [Octopus vulgaris]
MNMTTSLMRVAMILTTIIEVMWIFSTNTSLMKVALIIQNDDKVLHNFNTGDNLESDDNNRDGGTDNNAGHNTEKYFLKETGAEMLQQQHLMNVLK